MKEKKKMKLKLTFHQRSEKGYPKEIIVVQVETRSDVNAADLKRLWDMEQTFNDLTNGRLHVEVLE